jgi:hypothetical protein
LPKLMTKLDRKSSQYHFVQSTNLIANQFRAWSAAPAEKTPDSASVHRPIKSAASAPANPFSSPIERIDTPFSARLPGVGGRGRSIRLTAGPPRLASSTHSHLRSASSTFNQESGEQQVEAMSQSAGYSQMAEPSSIPVPKLHAPFSGNPLYGPFSALNQSSESLSLIRAVTAPETRAQGHSLHRRAFSHESGLRGASSALRNVCAEEIVVPPYLDVPDSITEADENSPPRVMQRPLAINTSSLTSPTDSRPETAFRSPLFSKPDVNKALPDLPSNLVPSPLFSHSFSYPNDQPKDLFFDFQQSRFSAWSEDLHGSEVDDSDLEVGDGWSSTFSSIWDSGHTSPLRFSDPFYSSLSSAAEQSGKHKTAQESDAASLQVSGEQGEQFPANDEPVVELESERQTTQLEQLFEEFDYLGAALL